MITTKNRRADLERALRSAVAQVPAVEVIVVDDGSADGSAEMVRDRFPGVRLERFEHSAGYIVRRNQAAEMATTPVIVSIDDDAEFSSSDTVAQTVAELGHPRVGAVAIPHIDVHRSPSPVLQMPPGDGVHVGPSYVGTAHAVTRSLFLDLGGYREELVHQAEEHDFCARMLAAGWVVRLGRADPIRHYESPARDRGRQMFYWRRNDVLFAWHQVPLPYLVGRLAKAVIHGVVVGARERQLGPPLRGLWQGQVDFLRNMGSRAPMSRRLYRLDRALRQRRQLPLEAIEGELPAQRT